MSSGIRLLSIFIISILHSINSFSQDSSAIVRSNKKEQRISIGINMSPDICYRSLSVASETSFYAHFMDLRNEEEKPDFGYTVGANIQYRKSDKFIFQAGIQYSYKSYQTPLGDLTFGDMIDPRFGFIYDTISQSEIGIPYKFTDNFHYLELPIKVIRSFGKKRAQFLVSGGITFNYLLKATHSTVAKYSDGSTQRRTYDQPYNFEKFNISPELSLGVSYKVSNKITIQVLPVFRYGLIKILDSNISEHLWNSGVNVSVQYSLK